MKKELTIVCKKCTHFVFVKDWNTVKKMTKVLQTPCPNCGLIPPENWVLLKFGDYKKEKKNFKILKLKK